VASYFIDTSALAKLYVKEPGSERMLDLVRSEEAPAIAILSVTQVELRSAVRKRQRAGDLTVDETEKIVERFNQHAQNLYERVSLNDPLIEAALSLVDRHALRAYDALQLAGCLEWKRLGAVAPSFVCSDKALLLAARTEGLATLDPTAGDKKVR
jgi:predicted nucleic acid-binding protein